MYIVWQVMYNILGEMIHFQRGRGVGGGVGREGGGQSVKINWHLPEKDFAL